MRAKRLGSCSTRTIHCRRNSDRGDEAEPPRDRGMMERRTRDARSRTRRHSSRQGSADRRIGRVSQHPLIDADETGTYFRYEGTNVEHEGGFGCGESEVA